MGDGGCLQEEQWERDGNEELNEVDGRDEMSSGNHRSWRINRVIGGL